MLTLEQRMIARAEGLNSPIGQLPRPGDKVHVVRAKPARVQVLVAGFYFNRRVPEVGEKLTMPSDDARDLVLRGLARLI